MRTRRSLAWFVAATMLLASFALPAPLGPVREAAASSLEAAQAKDLVASGRCGAKLSWSFDRDIGALTVTGSGAMYGYADGVNPWVENGFAGEITSVSLPKGLTEIGPSGFLGCSALASVVLPGKVKVIGESAFAQCDSLTAIELPKSVARIDGGAFRDCAGLQSVRYLGKMENRAKIAVCAGNGPLLDAAWTYAKTTAAAVAVKTQPKSIKVDEGKTATFKVKTAGASRIDWEYRRPGETGWTATGVTGDSYTVTASTLHDGWSFRCLASNGVSTVPSQAATLTVRPVQLVIKTQPKTVKTTEGKTATFKVKVTGATRLAWEVKKPGQIDWAPTGVTTDTLSFPARAEDDGTLVRCVACNDRTAPVCSDEAKLCLSVYIAQQPKAVKANEGETARFTVEGTGYTGVQWERQAPGSKVWSDVDGATAETLAVLARAADTGSVYRCRLYNNTDAKHSSKVRLTVDPVPLAITAHPASVQAEAGQSVSFTVAATGATAYRWQYQRPGAQDWCDLVGDAAAAATYTLVAEAQYDGYAFRCRASRDSEAVHSNAATLTIRAVTCRALLIGESNYSETALPGSYYNATSMAGMLQGLSNRFAATILQDASASEIRTGIVTAFAGADDDDVSLFYYSGHGMDSTSYYSLGALCAVDGSSIAFTTLAAELSQVKGRVIVILDSCHSGAAIGKGRNGKGSAACLDAYNQAVIDAFHGYRLGSSGGTDKWANLAASKFVVITSASYSEVCWAMVGTHGFDGGDYPQGLFTAALIQGMGCVYPDGAYASPMPADKDGDGLITLQEIYAYTYQLGIDWTNACDRSNQHTQYYGDLNEVLFRRK